MKEAIGNSFLVTLSLALMSLVMVILVASFVYSKTYRVKNRIVNIMEKRTEYNNTTKKEIYDELSKLGYRINTVSKTCPDLETISKDTSKVKLLHNTDRGNYDFCLYEVKTSRGHYFHVITYTHYDIPIVGSELNLAIKGDTRTIYSEVGG